MKQGVIRSVRALPPAACGLVIAAFALTTPGCVEQTMTVETNPPGALVYLNDQEVGRTPVTKDFLWYGTYDVTLRKEGYQTVKAKKPVIAPWYQWVPLDLIAQLLPIPIKDNHRLQFAMQPQEIRPGEADALVTRAEELKGKLETGTNPTTRKSRNASTVPTTQPR